MGKYQALVEFILKNVGGKDNVLSVTHCMTRLRFTLKDDSLVQKEEIVKSPDVMSAQFASGRFQVVVGTQVAEVFQVVQENLNGRSTAVEVEEKKGLVSTLIDTITKVITPVLGILTASGLLQGILALLTATKVLSVDDGAYIILHAMGQAVFYFLPVTLGYTSAKAFKMNPFVGMMLGATLLIPELLTGLTSGDVLYTLFKGSLFQTPVYNTFFGIPILFPATGYQYTVIPIIFIVYVGSKVEKWLKSVVPGVIAHNVNSFLTILITVPVAILIVGPVTNVLSSLISAGVSGLYTISPIVTSVAVALLYQPLVIFGLHWPISAIGITNLAQSGVDYIFPMSFTANFAQTAIVVAVFLRTRSKDQKALAIPAIVSGLFCIIEPAIYGFSLPVKKRFAFSMIGGAVGSLILALFSTKMYAMSFGVLGFAAFINPETGSMNGLFIAILATIATSVVAFVLTYFTFKQDEDVVDPEEKELVKTEVVTSPMKGQLKPIESSSDATFASKALGKGLVLLPESGDVVSPVNGVVETVLPSGHAIGIISDTGIEVLIHIGIDTVELEGQGFTPLVEKGQSVVQGEKLLEVDLAKVKAAGYSTETIVVVTNTDHFLDVICEQEGNIKVGEKLLTVVPFNNETELANLVEVN
ncbi:beta-glucoside-specific PTS transporter subunit IIABC [Enterococcus termitis]|uniref:PTS beta-glucoside transporter subunit EIIBCA n=1 Tax=Enterococcus termitis TaxID=332950 RepID=A0A1E5GCU5_9ENTE|nr:beta-glucoside-specific PTS transporter subunit IIABC [Enterococcus termitis]OEG10533.1 PTS beta-glucoside transporter subunit EIIBCA [Enterococcus termitis]OJG97527.1 PTS system, beta-glucoside-specific IIABC component [Enterococcus termitis]